MARDTQHESDYAKVYSDSDQQKHHVLYGGRGSADGPGHGHAVYDRDMNEIHNRPANGDLGQLAVEGRIDRGRWNS